MSPGKQTVHGFAPWPAPVDAQCIEQLRAEHDIAVLAALTSSDMYDHPLAVDIADLLIFTAVCTRTCPILIVIALTTVRSATRRSSSSAWSSSLDGAVNWMRSLLENSRASRMLTTGDGLLEAWAGKVYCDVY